MLCHEIRVNSISSVFFEIYSFKNSENLETLPFILRNNIEKAHGAKKNIFIHLLHKIKIRKRIS